MENELLPCPFCGTEPEKVYKSNGQTTHIECPNCKAQFPKSTMENRYDDAWNTRALCDECLEKAYDLLVKVVGE